MCIPRYWPPKGDRLQSGFGLDLAFPGVGGGKLDDVFIRVAPRENETATKS